MRARRSPWSVLGVERGANLDDCKAAYRKLALAMHPDVNQGKDASARFSEVVQAFEAIAGGDDDQGSRVGPRGVRSVGDVLMMSVEELKLDPNYAVYSVRIRLINQQQNETSVEQESIPTTPLACQFEIEEPTAALAAELDMVYDVEVSEWDSVADLCSMLHELLGLHLASSGPRRSHSGRHELLFRGQLLAEHLLLADYELRDGDMLHFAVRRNRSPKQ